MSFIHIDTTFLFHKLVPYIGIKLIIRSLLFSFGVKFVKDTTNAHYSSRNASRCVKLKILEGVARSGLQTKFKCSYENNLIL